MATITAIDTDLTERWIDANGVDAGVKFISAPATTGADLVVELTEGVTAEFEMARFAHVFVSVLMFDISGDIVAATAGTFTIEVKTQNLKQFEDIPNNTITALTPVTRDFAANTFAVRVTDVGLTTPATWRVCLTGNRS